MNGTIVYPLIVTYRYKWMRFLTRYATIILYDENPHVPESELADMISEETGRRSIEITGSYGKESI